MKIKNVYIYTKDSKKDCKFIDTDIKENNIKPENVFTDVSFEEAHKRDIVVSGFGDWDGVRIVDSNGKEELYKKAEYMKRIKKIK